MKVVFNFVFFQVAWLACVFGGANALPWLGPLVVLTAAAYHFYSTDNAAAEVKLLATAMLIGLVFDSALVSTGWLSYPSGQLHPLLAPYWLIALWAAFATTLNVSLNWLKGRTALAVIFGAIGGPMAWYGGGHLGGVSFHNPVAAYTYLAVGWAIITPLLVWLAERYSKSRRAA